MATQDATAASPEMVTQDATAAGPELPGGRVTERVARFWPGLRMLVLGIALLMAGVALAVLAGHQSHGAAAALILLCVLVFIASALVLRGLTAVVPGQARVVQLFGRYRGTIREPGLQWVNPFTNRIAVSTRIRNQESAQAKVNERTVEGAVGMVRLDPAVRPLVIDTRQLGVLASRGLGGRIVFGGLCVLVANCPRTSAKTPARSLTAAALPAGAGYLAVLRCLSRPRRPHGWRRAGHVACRLDRPVHHARVDIGPRQLGMDLVRPEQVGPVPDRVEPVREHDTRVQADEGRDRGVDVFAPLVGHIGVDEHQFAVRSEQLHQSVELAGGDDVVGAKADHHDGAQPAAVREAAHHFQAGRHLPAELGVDVDAWQHGIAVPWHPPP